MMISECFALMGSIGWLVPLSFMLLLGLGIVALAKCLFTSRRHRSGRA